MSPGKTNLCSHSHSGGMQKCTTVTTRKVGLIPIRTLVLMIAVFLVAIAERC